jgi:paraquat-inducible protein B
MSKRANPTVIGVFVLVAVALVITGILTLGGLELFKEEIRAVAFFDGDVAGLAVGSPVLFRGAQLGQVSKIEMALDPHNRIAVYVKIAPKREPESARRIRTQKDLQPLIDRGLRAQLRIVSLVTGQLSVSLDYLPSTPVVLTGLAPGIPELPTVPTTLEQYQARLDRLLVGLEKTDIAQLAQDITVMVRAISDLARSPELAGAVRNARGAFGAADTALAGVNTQVAAVGERAGATLDATRELVKKVDREVEPLVASLRTALDATRELVSKADRELDPIAGSLRSMLDATHNLVSKVDREVEPLAVSTRNTLDATRQLVSKADRELDPLAGSLRTTLDAARVTADSAQGALLTVNRALDGDTRLGDDLSQALHQITAAARSVNALATYLQQHPEALLRGKEGSDVR